MYRNLLTFAAANSDHTFLQLLKQLVTSLHSSSSCSISISGDCIDFHTSVMSSFFVGCCAAMLPSLISAVYLVLFLGLLLYWSLDRPFYKSSYQVFKFLVMTYLILHMILLYLCQFKFLQTWLDDPDRGVFYSRLVKLKSFSL